MQAQVLFTEVQQMVSKPVQRILWTLTAFFGISTSIQALRNGLVLTDVASVLLLGFAIAAIFSLLSLVKMSTLLTTDGVVVNYYPFYFKNQLYRWDAIAEAYVRPYNAMQEHMGWGIRINQSGMAYSVIGNTNGLQLILKNGGAVVITTAQPHVVEEVLNKLHNQK